LAAERRSSDEEAPLEEDAEDDDAADDARLMGLYRQEAGIPSIQQQRRQQDNEEPDRVPADGFLKESITGGWKASRSHLPKRDKASPRPGTTPSRIPICAELHSVSEANRFCEGSKGEGKGKQKAGLEPRARGCSLEERCEVCAWCKAVLREEALLCPPLPSSASCPEPSSSTQPIP